MHCTAYSFCRKLLTVGKSTLIGGSVGSGGLTPVAGNTTAELGLIGKTGGKIGKVAGIAGGSLLAVAIGAGKTVLKNIKAAKLRQRAAGKASQYLLLAELSNHSILVIDQKTNTMRTLIGNSSAGCSPSGTPISQVVLRSPTDMVFDTGRI
jgi:hypothetical protein